MKTAKKVRIILDLSKLNKFITYEEFKMDSIHTIVNMVKKDAYLVSIDLTDAYCSITISVREQDRRYLGFPLQGQLFEFWKGRIRNVKGRTSAPRIFTKLLKPIFATLRGQGFESGGYLDDSYLQPYVYDHCV